MVSSDHELLSAASEGVGAEEAGARRSSPTPNSPERRPSGMAQQRPSANKGRSSSLTSTGNERRPSAMTDESLREEGALANGNAAAVPERATQSSHF